MQLAKIENKAPKISELVMQAILNAINEGKIKLDEDLLPERELAATLGVGRSSLRESLAILEFLGIIELRGNRKVVVKDPAYIQKAISLLQLSQQTELLDDFLEYRRIIEVAIVRLACDRATMEDLLKLEYYVNKLAQDPTDALADCDFHTALANSSHNALLAASIELVNSMIMDLRIRFFAISDYHQKTLESHKAIFEAVKAQNKTLAEKEMIKHLKNIGNFSAVTD
ncbi:FadR/GntR family transcriptional regulator [Zophobihabitans entericus]|uniref:FadR family transcriptional regulator n=1 Tax=Zophobihabitans entericus TaxID=1635327 RepID=A0A6G9I8M2_9GAMM|nr:FCD domain-containing protein [Zophobihabitans entericus]QIQ20568.1 FadR family transcriptional regulator [Zophobihabitans entericus]